jgi:hypothetical protein
MSPSQCSSASLSSPHQILLQQISLHGVPEIVLCLVEHVLQKMDKEISVDHIPSFWSRQSCNMLINQKLNNFHKQYYLHTVPCDTLEFKNIAQK